MKSLVTYINEQVISESKYTLDNPCVIELPKRKAKYYVWNSNGDFYGTNDIENQRTNISDARKKQKFAKSEGFETIEDVKEYVLKYFDK